MKPFLNKQNEHTSPSPGRRRGGITRKKKVTPSLEIEEELANLVFSQIFKIINRCL